MDDKELLKNLTQVKNTGKPSFDFYKESRDMGLIVKNGHIGSGFSLTCAGKNILEKLNREKMLCELSPQDESQQPFCNDLLEALRLVNNGACKNYNLPDEVKILSDTGYIEYNFGTGWILTVEGKKKLEVLEGIESITGHLVFESDPKEAEEVDLRQSIQDLLDYCPVTNEDIDDYIKSLGRSVLLDFVYECCKREAGDNDAEEQIQMLIAGVKRKVAKRNLNDYFKKD